MDVIDYCATTDEDWGPWQDKVPPLGSVFVMWLGPGWREPTIGSHSAYQLKRVSGSTLELRLYSAGKWVDRHSWNLDCRPKFRIHKSCRKNSAVALDGCVCDRCNSRNFYATPNRPDGKYVCFECR